METNMATCIYFVRHAESEYLEGAERSRGLTERGKQDALKVRDLLMEEQIDVLVSSPYRRAIETIQHLADALNKEVIIEEDLRERKLSGTDFDLYQFYEAKRRVLEEPSFSFPGGESTFEVQQRAIPILTRLLHEYSGKNIAVATHGDIMTVMMNYYDKKYDYHFWENTTMPDIYRLQFDEKQNLARVTRLWK